MVPAVTLPLLIMLETVTAAAVDRKRNIEPFDSEASDISDNSYHSQEDNYEDASVERRMLEVLGLFEASVDDVESESDLSIYESIKDEKSSILTKIERLYNAFKSLQVHEDQEHEFPLLTIIGTEEHSITIRLKTKQLQQDTM